MSSSDNQNRYSRQGQPPDDTYEVDEILDDTWEDAQPNQQGDRARPGGRPVQPRQDPATPRMQGTAAQIERLRRNLGQSPASGPPPARTTSPAPRPRTAPADDMVVTGDAYYEDDDVWAAPAPAPAQRTTRRSAPAVSSRTQPTSSVWTSDAGYDDQYEEDGYLDYDDDFSEYDDPRPPARATRPQVRMPAISRPTMPSAIANADLVNDAPALGIIGVGIAGLAAMAIVVANKADSLAPQFGTHVSASGVLESFKSESFLWNLPLMAATFTLMNLVIAWFISPMDRFASRFVLVGALVVQFVAWVALIRIL